MSKGAVLDMRTRGETVSRGREHVIIPTKDAATQEGVHDKGITHTLTYLHRMGFSPDRVHVVVNGCTDNTAEEARATGLATVHLQEEVFDQHPGVIELIEQKFGLERAQLRGKGVAMFAGMLALRRLNLRDDDPVIFLDADIEELHHPDPVACLLAGWEAWKGDVKLVKLASKGRDNTGIHAYLGITKNLRGIGAFEWPLCGQVLLPWGVVRKMRFAHHYAVEVAMLIDLWLADGTTDVFGEVEVLGELIDDRNTDQTHVRMFAQIMRFLQIADDQADLRHADPRAFNINGKPEMFRVPSEPGGGPTRLERRHDNGLLPSMRELCDLI